MVTWVGQSSATTTGSDWIPISTTGTGFTTTLTYGMNVTITASSNTVAWNQPNWGYLPVEQVRALTAQEERAYARAQVEQAQRATRAAAQRDASFRTAEALLLEWLDEDQVQEYRTRRVVTVESDLGNVFEVECANRYAGNVFRLEDGRRVASYCVHTSGFPPPDAWLAQVLALEADEAGLMAIANETRLVPAVLAA